MEKNARPKVLYLYAGSRREFYDKWKKGLVPNTQLLGLNYMEELGVDAEFLEWPLPERLRKINFNLVHLPYIFAIRKYDVVFICAGLPLVFLAKWILRWRKPKFVIYNTFLTNALKRNPHGLSSFITRKAIEKLDKIVCTSKAQEKFLLERGFDREKIVFCPIGIDAAKFFERSKQCTETENYIVSAGRDLGRDYKTLFKAVDGLPIKVKVATKKETLVGLNIPQNVKIFLNVPYEDMPDFYGKARFAIVALRDHQNPAGSDTSGQYGYLEPMAGGKAVIATDKETVRDYIENGVDGILVPPNDPVALKTAIEELLANPAKAAALGAAAKAKVLENFTSKKFAERLAEIFRALTKD